MTYQDDKKRDLNRSFVMDELDSMLYKATGAVVRELAYEFDGCQERVDVYARPEGKPPVKFSVDVTGCDRWIVASKVMSAVDGMLMGA